MTLDPLTSGGYPALYEQANAASLRGQSRYLQALRFRLSGMIAATIGGTVILASGYNLIGGWVALLGFLIAIAAESYSSITAPDKAWYEGRAAAESVKTLTWRYVVRGSTFAGEPDKESDRRFLERLRDALHDLHEVELSEPSSGSEQITVAMKNLRASSFEDRKIAYRDGRIEDQRSWYASKSEANGKAGRSWTLAILLLEGLGVVGAILTIVGALSIDLLALFAAVAAALTAWAQAKQHKNLATAYGITAQELAGVKSELALIGDEVGWARFVNEAEEAISREHTLWRASRGVRIRK
ncbi:DUF4231 domain-containing protein [Salinibacterium sp. NSLL150]|uniref:DUF4231 domain-containing protein n=1 Tax=unclassified Salinibacterium TaxID=2632331 RepID=UPI0018CF8B7B|nr:MULTISPECIES: DUF4231 domain-containing protein [unclassified Salinibacterium]MBH0098777.1 DUF4231 domain-containing protein [Salinibacterium sp. NSLL35]MBH0101532.1 DUF4231 domain-containing protein [Salinibacterium sp. NSLL150]MBH0104291.1 DUF4231 domain-containing protein [Salinibacterium sp. NSLL16]MBH0107052.1 DUF4231 domain-containing protein [Salinibacterium sp. NSLL17]